MKTLGYPQTQRYMTNLQLDALDEIAHPNTTTRETIDLARKVREELWMYLTVDNGEVKWQK